MISFLPKYLQKLAILYTSIFPLSTIKMVNSTWFYSCNKRPAFIGTKQSMPFRLKKNSLAV